MSEEPYNYSEKELEEFRKHHNRTLQPDPSTLPTYATPQEEYAARMAEQEKYIRRRRDEAAETVSSIQGQAVDLKKKAETLEQLAAAVQATVSGLPAVVQQPQQAASPSVTLVTAPPFTRESGLRYCADGWQLMIHSGGAVACVPVSMLPVAILQGWAAFTDSLPVVPSPVAGGLLDSFKQMAVLGGVVLGVGWVAKWLKRANRKK